MVVSNFREQVLADMAKMLGTERVETYSASRVEEILLDNPHLVNYQDFNEVLAYVGEARSTSTFFTHYFGTGFQSVDSLSEAVKKIRTHSFLFYGNFSAGFRTLSQCNDTRVFERIPWDIEIISRRPMTTDRIEPLTADQAHATGYLTGQENPLSTRQKGTAIRKASNNTERYLAMNGVDVYVAGSMRALSDFQDAETFVEGVRRNPSVRQLGLSFFNPLWSYMGDSQQKGLLEQLMLKKAQTMVYMAGTYDSFGKDSELATMLVQCKPVVVYVAHPPPPPSDSVPGEVSYDEWQTEYDKQEQRFKTFSESHPLRIQCDLKTGVANGLMVCRDFDTCAKLLYGLFTNTLEFCVDDSDPENIFLRERLTGSAVRVITRNPFLTNSFWHQWQSI